LSTWICQHPIFDPQNILVRVRQALLAAYGPQRDVLRHDPGSQFIKAFVSAKTLDAASEKALQNLRHCFRRWEALANSSHEIIFHSSGRFITRETKHSISLLGLNS
jgi:endonuclease III